MYRKFAIVSAALLAAISCDNRSEVQRDTEDLREAQRNAPRAAEEIQRELENAKAEVIRLEEKLAMARQGITDEVISERNELEQALKDQQEDVKEEIDEAKREAQLLDRDSEKAARQLEQTQPPARVEANVTTETEVVEQQQAPVQRIEREEVIPVRGTVVADAGSDEDEGTLDQSTSPAPAPNDPAPNEPASPTSPAPTAPPPAPSPAQPPPAPMPPR